MKGKTVSKIRATKPTAVGVQGVFRSVHAALQFAFDISERKIIAQTQLAQWVSKSKISETMTAHEWHAQGAMIRNYIEAQLAERDAAYILSTYAHGALREAAVLFLLKRCPEFSTVSDSPAVVDAVVRRYFSVIRGGKGKSLRAISASTGKSHVTAHRAEIRLKAVVVKLFNQTDSKIESDFRRSGLIDSVTDGGQSG